MSNSFNNNEIADIVSLDIEKSFPRSMARLTPLETTQTKTTNQTNKTNTILPYKKTIFYNTK